MVGYGKFFYCDCHTFKPIPNTYIEHCAKAEANLRKLTHFQPVSILHEITEQNHTQKKKKGRERDTQTTLHSSLIIHVAL